MQPIGIKSKNTFQPPVLKPARAETKTQNNGSPAPTGRRLDSDFQRSLMAADSGGPAATPAACKAQPNQGPLRTGAANAGGPENHSGPTTAAQTDGPSPLRRQFEKLLKDEAKVEKHLKRTMRRGVSSMEELLKIQMSVYRYVQHVDLMSKVVDRVNGAVKQTLQTRV
jgi:hypothetical protein